MTLLILSNGLTKDRMNNREISIWNRITSTDKLAFTVAMVSGVLTHLYALTNKLPTFDDLMCLNSFGGGVSLGRWFLEILGLLKHKLFGNYSTPSINGLLSVFFIAIAAGLFCRILGLESRKSVIAVSILLPVFPVMTGYMAFVYTAYYYCFAMVLLLAGVWLIQKKQSWCWNVIGCVIVSFSIAIYQAYLPLYITLLLCALWIKSLSEENASEVLKTGFRYLLDVAVALVFYFAGNIIMQKLLHASMSDMKGGDRIGSVLLEKGFGIIPYIYGTFGELVTGNYYGLTGKVWLQYAIAVLYTITIALLGSAINGSLKKRKIGIAILQITIAFLLPIGIHSLYAMVEKEYFYTLMLYVDIMIFVLPIMLLEHEEVPNPFTRICGIACAICIIYSSCLYVIQDNAAYLKMDLGMSASKSYYTTLITQIKSLPDYDPEYPVVFVGHVEDPTLFDLQNEYFGDVAIGGTYGSAEAVKGMYLDLFLKQYCGFETKSDAAYERLDKNVIDKMPCYPRSGSITIDESIVIVKLSNER